jgi:sulfotransferase family protein
MESTAASLPRSGDLAQLEAAPIFICGHIRSGTTWVLDLLSAHPQVADLFESLIFTGSGLAPLLADIHWDFESSERMFDRRMGLGQMLDRERVLADVRALCDRWLARALEPHHRFLVEKTPGDARSIQTLAKLYPDAAVIHVLRDGRDVAISSAAARRGWQRREAQTDDPRAGSRHLWGIGLGWARQVSLMRAELQRTEIRGFEVRYEQMHERPIETARALFEFCRIPVSEEQLAELVDQVHFSKLPKTGPESFRRSGKVGNWRTEWNRGQRLLFTAAAGPTLEKTGYAPPMIWQARALRWLLMRYEKLKQLM